LEKIAEIFLTAKGILFGDPGLCAYQINAFNQVNNLSINIILAVGLLVIQTMQ